METLGSSPSDPRTVSASGRVEYVYVRPELGWQWVLKEGVFIGVRLGAEVPVAHSKPETTATYAGTAYGNARREGVANVLGFVSTHALPALTLFEVGYMF